MKRFSRVEAYINSTIPYIGFFLDVETRKEPKMSLPREKPQRTTTSDHCRSWRMSALWEFLLSSLQDTLGKDLGRLVAVIFCLLLVLAFGAPLFLVMRSTTNLRSRRDDPLAQDSGGESLNPVILPRSDANPDTSLHASAQPVILPQSGGPELQSRNDLNLRNVERGGLA